MAEWRRKTSLPGGGRWMAGALTGGRLYLTGGDRAGGEPSRELWIYDLGGDCWLRGPELPLAVSGHACVLLEDSLWCLGGRGAEGPVDAVQVFHIGSGRWSLGPPLPRARWQHGAAAVSGALLLAGGHGGQGLSRGETWRLDPVRGAWEEWDAMPTPRRSVSCCALEGSLYCMGGFALDGSAPLDTVERLDGLTGQWSVCPPLPAPRWGGGCGAVGRCLYNVGGYSGTADVLEGGVWRREGFAPALSGCCAAAGEETLLVAGGFFKGMDYSGELWELEL